MAAGEHEQASDPGLEVLSGLADRILGGAGTRVVWKRLSADGATSSLRRFEFEATGGRLVVRGSDVLGAALGFHEYLKSVVHRRVCWDTVLPLALGGEPLGEPTPCDSAFVSAAEPAEQAKRDLDAASGRTYPLKPLATLPDCEPTSATVRVNDAYYLNFCTFSYTTAYWDWERWQREIDWMALHGVTMPLAAVGHEAVLARVYRDLGLHETEILEFLGGPGYLPFQFMGCLDSWAGPMPAPWLAEREQLGARIIARQIEYGMTPVLPAFTGHVPQSLAGAGTTERSWWGFTTSLLAPHDPRFASITQRVVEAQRQMFGTAHLYAADPFIEMTPPSDDPHYLTTLAGALVAGLRAGDPDATWVMQAWTFEYLDYWTDDRIAAFLDAVPDDAMLVLDLWGEHAPQWRRFGGFRGKRWVWCALHNFGGRNDVYGNFASVHDELEAALLAPSPPIGVGLAMEATEQNPVVYEMALDLAGAPIADVTAWSRGYAVARYGVDDPPVAAAWDRLATTVYDAPPESLTPSAPRGCVALRPTLGLALDEGELRMLVDGSSWYNPTEVFDAWRDLLGVASAHPELLPAELGHDLVSVAATAMSRACDRLLVEVVAAWHRSAHDLAAAGLRFLTALGDLDVVLSIRPEFRLGTWEAAATSHARATADRRVLLDNARRIVSVWSTGARPALTDYSARLWSGVVAGLYRERWREWLDELVAAQGEGRAPDESALTNRIDAVTEAFLAGAGPKTAPPVRDPLAELQRLLAAYSVDH